MVCPGRGFARGMGDIQANELQILPPFHGANQRLDFLGIAERRRRGGSQNPLNDEDGEQRDEGTGDASAGFTVGREHGSGSVLTAE